MVRNSERLVEDGDVAVVLGNYGFEEEGGGGLLAACVDEILDAGGKIVKFSEEGASQSAQISICSFLPTDHMQ